MKEADGIRRAKHHHSVYIGVRSLPTWMLCAVKDMLGQLVMFTPANSMEACKACKDPLQRGRYLVLLASVLGVRASSLNVEHVPLRDHQFLAQCQAKRRIRLREICRHAWLVEMWGGLTKSQASRGKIPNPI